MQVRQAILTSWLNTFHHFKSVSKCHEVMQSSQTFLRSCRFCRQSELSDTDCSRSPPKSSELNKQHRVDTPALTSERGWGRRGRGESINVLSGTAAVTDVVPIGYDARNTSIKLMEVQRNCPSRLTITCFNKKKAPWTQRSPSTQMPRPINQEQVWAGARTWAFVSLRTNKSQSVDTMVLFSSPAIIQHVQPPLTGCQRPFGFYHY